ncbi:hypothetical protein [Persephonella sp. KM09-Lau-8]|uniref:hypothetical protein n=1 Tax=Persephonella sp. KM09-Lau-8 TaxID=1158345 RepID=UPI000494F6EE|nr:hypothetical protein [Persephonella sp. KM09-Lau-8]
MNLTKILGRLTVKEYILLSLPIIIAIFLYILFPSYLERAIYKIAEDNLNYSPEIPKIPSIVRIKTEGEQTLISLIEVRPYTAPKIEEKTKTVEKAPPPTYRISFIYIGKHKYVIIDNKLWSEGDTLPYGEKILRITKDGVLVTGKWGERWIKFLR